MIERLIACTCLTGIAALGIAAPVIGQRLTSRGIVPDCASMPPCERTIVQLVSDLDAMVQRRFRSVDALGIRRLVIHLHDGIQTHFRPDGAEDVATICGLVQHGADVALYLAGRGELAQASAWNDSRATPTRRLSRAVHVAGGGAQRVIDGLPEHARIAAIADAVFDHGSVTERSNGWTLVGRSVPASSARCLDCHRGKASAGAPGQYPPGRRLAVGDTLGAVVYAVRSGQTPVAMDRPELLN